MKRRTVVKADYPMKKTVQGASRAICGTRLSIPLGVSRSRFQYIPPWMKEFMKHRAPSPCLDEGVTGEAMPVRTKG